MRLFNFRLGFANNSSSSHSFILLSDGAERHHHQSAYDDNTFGWDRFTLGTLASKRAYMAVILGYALGGLAPASLIAPFVNAACGTNLTPDLEYGGFEDASIDHQSVFALPRNFKGDDLNHDFFAAFKAWIERPDVAILGGNDNTSVTRDDGTQGPHRLPGKPLILPDGGVWTARADRGDGGPFWTLFSRETGAKIRMSFDDPFEGRSPAWTGRPELVDLKITDRCPFEHRCGYCYQGSTIGGTEADPDVVWSIARALGEMEVFEVAIGGGEPTLWPHFTTLLALLRQEGIVPNFTTQNLAWLRDGEQRAQIMEHIGSFAFSATTAEAARGAIETCIKYDFPLHKMQIQIIPALFSAGALATILDLCAVNAVGVTMLGYKTTGRGAAYAFRGDDAAWVPLYKARREEGQRNPAISIDTAMAQRLDLAALGVDRVFYHTEEGRYSMYVDAVTGKAGPSSFCDDADYRALDTTKRYQHSALARQIGDAFASWRPAQE